MQKKGVSLSVSRESGAARSSFGRNLPENRDILQHCGTLCSAQTGTSDIMN